MEDYLEKDKAIASYLLTRKDIDFKGTQAQGDTLFFIFSPSDKAQTLGELFLSRKADPVQPKDLTDAQETVKNLIWKWRNARDLQYGKYSR